MSESMREGEGPVHVFQQNSRFANYAPLVLKNAILGLLTLTLYRFWGRTEMRRRLWRQTSIMDDALEYTGTGMELFRGFLIAIPVLFAPFIFVFYIAPILFPGIAFFLILGFYPIILPLFGVALYLMRRYQLSRTRWRGIRFGLRGSAIGFGFANFGWMLLELLTLGWYGPAARMRRARRFWGAAYFGDQPFEFATDEPNLAKGLYGPFALGRFGGMLAFLVAAVVSGLLAAVAALAIGLAPAQFDPEFMTEDPLFLGYVIFVGLVFFLVYLFCTCWFGRPTTPRR
jgi:uncharacterized membrane protein YjgN (DUF898 family)